MSPPTEVLHRGGGDNCHPPPKYCTGGGVTIVTPLKVLHMGGGDNCHPPPPKVLHRGGG